MKHMRQDSHSSQQPLLDTPISEQAKDRLRPPKIGLKGFIRKLAGIVYCMKTQLDQNIETCLSIEVFPVDNRTKFSAGAAVPISCQAEAGTAIYGCSSEYISLSLIWLSRRQIADV